MSSEIWTPYDGTVGIFLFLMWNMIMGNLKSSHLLWRPVEIWQLVSYSKKMLGKETEKNFSVVCFLLCKVNGTQNGKVWISDWHHWYSWIWDKSL